MPVPSPQPLVPAAGRLLQAHDVQDAPRLTADVVVVGSGAGGAMLARDVARSGLQVIVLEQGRDPSRHGFTQREGDMLPLLFQASGGQTTVDGAVQILSGRGLGGSTLHNTNLCKRAPAEVLDRWATELGADGWSAADLAPDYAAVEHDLSVSPMGEADVNAHNALFRRGVTALGWRGALLHHNRVGCVRSGFCELGCAYNAKQNAHKVLLPQAMAAGATLICDVRATAILTSHGRRVLGVRAQVHSPSGRSGPTIDIQARAVCLCASAIGSATLLRASDIPDPHRVAGRSLRLHPAIAVAGIFPEAIDAWHGIPQSYECTQLLSFAPGARDRTWLIPAFAHPGAFAGLLPGFGTDHARAMRDYRHVAALAAMLHDETRGEVRPGRDGRPQIRYRLTTADADALWRGVRGAAEVLFAAGAGQVLVPLSTPLVARRMSDLDALARHRYRPLDPLLTSTHPMGTLPMGRDPRRSTVDPTGRHHTVRGLYVGDGSLFPTSIGGPPQLSIYAAGRRVARSVIADLRS